MLRPDPFAIPVSGLECNKIVGRPVSSTIRLATIPSTPSCQESSFKIIISGNSSHCFTLLIADSKIDDTISCLLLFVCWIFSTISANSSSSNDNNRCTPGEASCRRPSAFKRGPITKPIVSSLIASRDTDAFSSNKCSPIRSVFFNASIPCCTIHLFSSVKLTRSLTVPIAATSKNSYGVLSKSAAATFSATPAPDKSPNG